MQIDRAVIGSIHAADVCGPLRSIDRCIATSPVRYLTETDSSFVPKRVRVLAGTHVRTSRTGSSVCAMLEKEKENMVFDNGRIARDRVTKRSIARLLNTMRLKSIDVIYFFLFHPRDYYKLSPCVTFNNTVQTVLWRLLFCCRPFTVLENCNAYRISRTREEFHFSFLIYRYFMTYLG